MLNTLLTSKNGNKLFNIIEQILLRKYFSRPNFVWFELIGFPSV